MASNQRLGPPWFQEICEGYLRHLKRKGRRPNTFVAYGYAFLDFSRWLDSQAIADSEHLTGADLERWQDALAGRSLPSTGQMYAAAMRGCLRFGATREPALCSASLWMHVSTPRTARLLPKPIPRVDLDKLLAALASKPRDLLRLRTRALFLVVLSSGARISEALSLNRDQLRDRTATVIQKGGSEKLLVIGETAQAAVDDYIAGRRDSGHALFIDHRHRGATRLTRDGAQDGWDRLCAEVGVPRFSNHRVRHSCATELLRQGVDALTLAHHLGHRSLAAIQGYAQVGLEARREMLAELDDRIRRAS